MKEILKAWENSMIEIETSIRIPYDKLVLQSRKKTPWETEHRYLILK